MNEQERKLLSELVLSTDPPVTFAGTAKWLAVWGGALVLCVLAAAAILLLDVPILAGIAGGPIAIAAIMCHYAFIVVIGGYFRCSRYQREFVRRDVPEIRAALADGRVFVNRVSAEAVIEIVEFEDEGSGYIYDVGDGKSCSSKDNAFTQ